MRTLRIIFMGTPDFAVASLRAILNNQYEVAAVITAPDRPAGRGRKLQQSAVKQYADEENLKVLQPTNLKSPEFISQLHDLKPNVFVVVAFRMLPKEVWKIPQYGTFNLHASLLPQYRGAAPINWAIINGEEETGVTTFFIDDKIDTGKTIINKSVKIEASESAGELHDRLMEAGADLVVETLKVIKEDKAAAIPQEETTDLKSAVKLTRENTRINWNRPLEEVFNFIRGLSPYPSAWTILNNNGRELIVKIYKTEKKTMEHQQPNGKLLREGNNLLAAVPGGMLLLKELQFPGKRKMPVKDLLNGFVPDQEAKFV
ncbi:MAG TPA: methionyl-tRNA formyltransferase [Salinimicrobium sp.]|nr:methionyl-tRNA formyltransferase [Salinimicrobium sp.]